jgi:mannose-6-phosphate isomerase-like protein (cupin superfamily)
MQRLAMLSVLCTLLGCAPTPRLLLPSAQSADQATLSTLLAAHPLPPGEHMSALLLGRTESLSYHLIQIRDREQPHRHATHDLSVALLRGAGDLYIAGKPLSMRAGDVAVVRRGSPHYFVNAGSEPAVAFATFAPPYDGNDQVPAE